METEDPRIARLLNEIQHDHNRGMAARWVDKRLVNDVDPKTVQNELRPIVDLLIGLGKPVEDATEEDLNAVLKRKTFTRRNRWGKDRTVTLGDQTFAERRKVIRSFFRAIGKPDLVKDIKANRSKKPRYQPKDLPTDDEIRRMLDAARTNRDRAIIAVLAEAGPRESELASLRVRDVATDGDGSLVLTLPEAANLKTGRREVTIWDSATLVNAWMAEHPARQSVENGDAGRKAWLDAPLFCAWDGFIPLKGRSIYDVVWRTAERAGVEKDVSPHRLRFAAITRDAKRGMPVSMLAKKYGHSDTSLHPLYYTRLAQSDLLEWERVKRGLKPAEDVNGSLIQAVLCARCRQPNRPGLDFCGKCGKPLTLAGETQAQERKKLEMRREVQELIATEIAKLRHTTVEPARAMRPRSR